MEIHIAEYLVRRCPPSRFSLSVPVASLNFLGPTSWLILQVTNLMHLPTKQHPPSELYAARNSINNVTDLSDLTKLKILDMEKWVDFFKRFEI